MLFSPATDAAIVAREFFHAFSCVHSFFGNDDPRFRQTLPQAAGSPVFFHPFRPKAEGHIAAAWVKSLGEPVSGRDLFARVALTGEDLAEARRIIESRGIRAGHYVLLMPGSGSRTKNWPVENYLDLAQHLGRSMPTVAMLGPAEEDMEVAFSGLDPIKSPSLGTLAGLARLSTAFVGNDSGSSHLAAAAGAQGVVIFGPSDPVRWCPLGQVTVLRRMPLRDLRWQEVARALRNLRVDAESSR